MNRSLAERMRLLNRGMVGFDLALGLSTLLAPGAVLKLLGHEPPSEDARHLFRRCAPIWLTFAAAHGTAAARGRPEDWWALSWLRGTEIATDLLWSASPALSRPGAKTALRMAGAFNLAAALGFAALSRRGDSPSSQS